MTTTSPPVSGAKKAQVGVQRFGAFLAGMIMPNIAAFIAWGLITALFIPNGWVGVESPVEAWQWAGSEKLVQLVDPMIFYLLPLLIANTAGRIVYNVRGGVVATIATMGVIVGTEIPMFLGAMIMGPIAAWAMKKVDRLWEGKIKPGFEMLVDNFSAGILGGLLAVLGYYVFGPLVEWLSNGLGAIVDWLVVHSLLPLLSIIVEPAKILFLNNAINHGVFTPIGTIQARETGQSVLFLVEANPGPGLGILLAFAVFGVGAARASAPGAIIIQFLGGIHEIYFPYVLMKPVLIVAAIAGGMTGVATNLVFDSGLRAAAAPGSIFAVLIQTPVGSYVGVVLSVVFAATVSFLISAVILRASRKKDLATEGAGDLSAAIAKTEANKGKSSSTLSNLAAATAGATAVSTKIENIVFACDAGMGSSAMGASVLRKKLAQAGVEGVTVVNKAVANLDDSADLVITQQQLTDRARGQAPDAIHVSVDNFMNSPKYEEVVDLVREQRAGDD